MTHEKIDKSRPFLLFSDLPELEYRKDSSIAVSTVRRLNDVFGEFRNNPDNTPVNGWLLDSPAIMIAVNHPYVTEYALIFSTKITGRRYDYLCDRAGNHPSSNQWDWRPGDHGDWEDYYKRTLPAAEMKHLELVHEGGQN